jgi:hypothetical protein
MRLMPGAHYTQLALTVIKAEKNYVMFFFHTEHETGVEASTQNKEGWVATGRGRTSKNAREGGRARCQRVARSMKKGDEARDEGHIFSLHF